MSKEGKQDEASTTAEQQQQQQQRPQKSIEEIKAEARRHALSSTSSSKKRTSTWQQAQALAHEAKRPKTTAAGGVAPYPPPLYPYPPPMMPPHAPPLPPSAAAAAGDDKGKSASAVPVPGEYLPHGAYPYPYHPYYPPGYYPPPPHHPSAPANSQQAAAAAAAYHHQWHQHHQAYAAAAAAYSNRKPNSSSSAHPLPTTPPTPPLTAAVLLQDPNVDDYTKFVKAMQISDWWKLFEDDADEEEDGDDYKVEEEKEEEEEEEDDDDDDDEDEEEEDGKPAATTTTNTDADAKTATTTATEKSKETSTAEVDMDLTPLDFGADDDSSVFYKELREELGWLEEEDMEAAVATLLQDTKLQETTPAAPAQPHEEYPHAHHRPPHLPYGPTPTPPPGTPLPLEVAATTTGTLGSAPAASWPRTPLRGKTAPSSSKKTNLTAEQYVSLVDLMKKHYQLLVQQSVLAIRAAHAQKYQNRILSRVAAAVDDDEPDEAKKAKYRASFWMGHESSDELVECLDGAIGMLQDLNQNRKDAFRNFVQTESGEEKRLTRAQFQKSLKELSQGAARTVFDIPGISNLSDTFALIDKSVQADENETEEHFLLETESVEDACKFVLDRAKAVYDRDIVPGARDLSFNFSDPREYCGDDFKPPCNAQQDLLFRRNRTLFSAGEDNLVLRGVNLYGEKQWTLIADRFLPERSIHIISQRYSKLCMMIYMANGVKIDSEGLLEKPPQVCDMLSQRQKNFLESLKSLEPPAILNVHRWSLKEDLMLLKAVPIMGNSWAKLGTYIIPYRDRGHLRKRYQVLERRVKSTMQRANRKDFLEALNVRPPAKARAPPTKSDTRTETRSNQVSSPAKVRSTTSFTTPQRRPPVSTQAHSPYAYPPPPYSPYGYPYGPPMYSPGYMYPPPPFHGDETSRIAFEKLAQESKGDWSQMSYMQNIMSPHRPMAPGAEGAGDKDKEQGGSLLGNVLQKAENGGIASGSNTGAPGTPAVKGTVYSTNGSPIGLSETFRSSPSHHGGDFMDSQLHGFGSNTMQSFPAMSRFSTTDESRPSQQTDDDDARNATESSNPPETSLDSFSSTYSSAYSRVRAAARPLFSDDSTLLGADLEAVSALNILSKSPALKKRKTVGQDKETEDKSRAKPKSLFAKVVGGNTKKQRKG